MSQQTPGQARVVDPILTTHARGYRQGTMVGEALFPRASVNAYGGTVLSFGKEAFQLYNTRRAPGGETKRIQVGYAGARYGIVPNRLEAIVPVELGRDSAEVPKINRAQGSVNTVLRSLLLGQEVDCATIARAAGNYDADHKLALAGANTWTGANVDPTVQVAEARDAIRQTIGAYPNTAVIGPSVLKACKFNPAIRELIKYGGSPAAPAQVTLRALADIFEIQNLQLGSAVVANAAGVFSDVWGDDFVLGYVPEGAGDGVFSIEEPSYGYTYVIENMPVVETPYFDNNRNSWIYPVTYDNQAVQTGMGAGFLISGAGTPQ